MTVEEYAVESAETIENLANAAVQNQVTVQALTATNTTITQNLIKENHKLKEALSTIAALQANGGGSSLEYEVLEEILEAAVGEEEEEDVAQAEEDT